jgi:prephenate dehydrogenase
MTAAASTSAEEPAGDRPAGDRSPAAAGLPARVAFLGFGLIAGSIARALRDADVAVHLSAWTPGGRGPAEGRRLGLLDRAASSPDEAVDGADLLVLAGPPLAVLDEIAELRELLASLAAGGATITDVASTKGRIVEAANQAALPFVGGHPMAGRELTGVEASRADLFVDRPWIVVPGDRAGEQDIARVEGLARAVRARPVRMAAAEHDRAVAAISHLPLVLAATLVEAVASGADWPIARTLAATGWADMTRLAKGDPDMGAGILATNAESVSERLRDLRRAIDGWIDALDGGEPDARVLRDRLAAARKAIDPGSIG